MADALVTWTPDVVIRGTKATLILGLAKAAQRVQDATKVKLNRSQPTSKAGPSGQRRGLDPSKPGEPPKRLESRLIQSITHEAPHVEGNDIVTRVGTNVIYARALELGFSGTDSAGHNRNLAPRPYLRPALAEQKDAIIAALGGKA